MDATGIAPEAVDRRDQRPVRLARMRVVPREDVPDAYGIENGAAADAIVGEGREDGRPSALA